MNKSAVLVSASAKFLWQQQPISSLGISLARRGMKQKTTPNQKKICQIKSSMFLPSSFFLGNVHLDFLSFVKVFYQILIIVLDRNKTKIALPLSIQIRGGGIISMQTGDVLEEKTGLCSALSIQMSPLYTHSSALFPLPLPGNE